MPTEVTPAPTTPTSPSLTVNSSEAELKAAMNAEAPVVPAPEVPVTPAWGEMQKQADGSFLAKLKSGEEFKGSAEEVISKLAEAKFNTKTWADEQIALAKQPQAPVAPVVPPEAWQVNPVEFANAMFERPAEGMVMGLAAALKTTPQDVAQFLPRLIQAVNTIEQLNANQSANDVTTQFLSAHPEFPNTKEATEALFKTLGEMGIPEDAKITPKLLAAGHRMALEGKLYQPVNTTQVTTPAPPPLPPAGGNLTFTNPGVISGDPNELRKLTPAQLAEIMASGK